MEEHKNKNLLTIVAVGAVVLAVVVMMVVLKKGKTQDQTASANRSAVLADAEKVAQGAESLDAEDLVLQKSGVASLTAKANGLKTPASRMIDDNQQNVNIGAFKFVAVNNSYSINQITLNFNGPNATTVTPNIKLVDNLGNVIAQKPGQPVNSFQGLSINIPANSQKTITVMADIGLVGLGGGMAGGESGVNIVPVMTSYTYTDLSNGVSGGVTSNISLPTGTIYTVYKSIPTITNLLLPTHVLVLGTNAVSKFSIGSNNTGIIAWKKIIFSITRNMSGLDTLSAPSLWDADSNVLINGNFVFTGSVQNDNGTSGTLSFVATNEQQISGTKNYVLKMNLSGSFVTGDNINVRIAQPTPTFHSPVEYLKLAGAGSSFVWSDVSAVNHNTANTSDWNSDFLVKDLPTNWQVLMK